MLAELSLNILDIANNSIRANATLTTIQVLISTKKDRITIRILDNVDGMSEEMLTHVEDPFYTTRTTRKIGLGIPFFKAQALACDGSFSISSKLGTGTSIEATIPLSHIDRMPLGDITSTIHTLITCNPSIDFDYKYTYDDNSFELDTRTFRAILAPIPFTTKEVSNYIREYLAENKAETDGNALI